jgi:hypothetical protein
MNENKLMIAYEDQTKNPRQSYRENDDDNNCVDSRWRQHADFYGTQFFMVRNVFTNHQ